MTKNLFLQVHTLTSYPASLLNRDDVGFAKRLPFGGATRTRISSQCLKRHWRTFAGEHSLGAISVDGEAPSRSVRSRHTFEEYVVGPLLKDGVAVDLARAATEAVMVAVLGESAKAKKAKDEARTDDAAGKGKKKARKDDEGSAPLQTGQITVFGRPEVDFFLSEARSIAKEAGTPDRVEEVKKARFSKDWGKNLLALERGAGLDAALFGRMVTSDRLARADAAVHVAHAFTVHGEHAETDYFAAIDDLMVERDELGSGHIGTTELTSGLFYGYVVVDAAQLVSNLEGCDARAWGAADRRLAAQVVQSLIQTIPRVSPGAKLGSTAPYAYAHLTMVEVGGSQPRTLANAFLKPVADRPDLVANTYAAMSTYLREVDEVYGLENRRALAAIGPRAELAGMPASASLESVAKFAAGALLEHTA